MSARGVCADCFDAEVSTESGLRPGRNIVPVVSPPAKNANDAIRPRSFLPRTRSRAVFVLAMSCYSVTITYLIIAWAGVARVESPPAAVYSITETPVGDLLVTVVFAPIVESLLLIGLFELARRASAPEAVQVLTAAFLISVVHVWPWWPHSVVVFPAFCIQSAAYCYWRPRGPFKQAFWIVASIHALNNVIPALSMVRYALREA